MPLSNLTLVLALRQSTMEYEDLEKKYIKLQNETQRLKSQTRKLGCIIRNHKQKRRVGW